MHANVYLRRRFGQRLSDQEESQSGPLVGLLSLSRLSLKNGECVEELRLRRVNNNTPEGVLATLYEPTLIGLGSGWISFRGFENRPADSGPVGYVQEWRCYIGDRVTPQIPAMA